MSTLSYLPYHEPTLFTLLITSTFILSVNILNSILDRTLACGLVGQVLIGTAWGAPGAKWLSLDVQRVVSDIGYVGLILVVFAGGVETDVAALRKNIVLSVAVAATGVLVPIGLSFALLASPGPFLGTGGGGGGGGAVLLPAFAAGAALCSTSLGTTFSVLQASGLSRTRLGAVLASAALLDDVVGLVMVRIITSLGRTGNSGIEPATILRPVLVSLAFAIAVPLACCYVLRPFSQALDRTIQAWDGEAKGKSDLKISKKAKVTARIRSQEAGFILQTALLILLVVAADYAGASILLAAYLAGVIVSWWDGQRDDPGKQPLGSESGETPSLERKASAEPQAQDHHGQEPEPAAVASFVGTAGQETFEPCRTASSVFDTYYLQPVDRVFKPFFFASIGFSIPISQLFAGRIVWRGLIYSILMIIGKLVCGLWLVRFPISISPLSALPSATSFVRCKYNQSVSKIRSWSAGATSTAKPRSTGANEGQSSETSQLQSQAAPTELTTALASTSTSSSPHPTPTNSEPPTPPRPLSLYPASILGSAMVARGEIGFLISSMAETQGVFRLPSSSASSREQEGASELFLIVTWAIFVCTITGPICTGLLVRRIKKLERKAGGKTTGSGGVGGSERDVLGVWGVG